MAPESLDKQQVQRFQSLAWPLRAVVLRTARYLTRRDDEAEDLAQDTMIKALRAMDSFQDGTDMKAWLMTILRRTHIDRLRAAHRHDRELSLDALELEPASPSADQAGHFDGQWGQPEDLMARFEDEAIIQAMQALPEDIRWTLLLVDVEQMPQADVAAVLDVPQGTIKSRTHRGRAMLRDRLYEFACQRGWVNTVERPAP